MSVLVVPNTRQSMSVVGLCMTRTITIIYVKYHIMYTIIFWHIPRHHGPHQTRTCVENGQRHSLSSNLVHDFLYQQEQYSIVNMDSRQSGITTRMEAGRLPLPSRDVALPQLGHIWRPGQTYCSVLNRQGNTHLGLEANKLISKNNVNAFKQHGSRCISQIHMVPTSSVRCNN